jgi:hypothetical protein
MTEVKHTPGPWLAEFYDYGDELWFGGSGMGMWCIGPAYLGGEGDTPEGIAKMKADALLIAAAPDLLAVCKDIEGFLKRSGYDTALVRAAIAKAEGRA